MRTTALVSAIVAGLVPSVVAAPTEAMVDNIIAKFGKDLTAKNHYGSPLPPWQPGSKPGWYYGLHPEKSPATPPLTPDNCKWLSQYPQAIHCPHYYLSPPPPSHYPSYHPPHHSPHSSAHATGGHTVESTSIKSTLSTQPPYTTTTTVSVTSQVYASTVSSNYIPAPETTTTTTTSYGYSPPQPSGYYPTFSNITAAVQTDDYMTYGLVETIDDCKAMCDSIEGCGFINTYHDVHGKDGSSLLTCSLFEFCHGSEDADNRGGQSQSDGSINFIANSDGWCRNYY